MSRQDMTIYEHIGELRKRLIIVIAFLFLTMIAGLFLAEPIIRYLQHADEAQELTMNAFRVTDPIKIYFQMAFVIAFVLTSPMILYQLWAFVSPGLLEKERKVTLSYIPLSLLLFLAGIAFSYFILFPYIIHFMMKLSGNLQIEQVIGINEYFQFLFQITLPFGILFQLPVVTMFLTRLGIITPMFLAQIRRYAYFVLLVVAGLITPPDVISQIIVMIPLVILYEISIWISKISYKKTLQAELEAENAE
ncbi:MULTISPECIES: twin-arginine translocase subunit TatC [Bacillaceae]|uniref:twin-arginine translocase subunit TatC n=1 Tax=Bacillaceae TaxID=186817 RepID=UPI000E72E725|nr:twin-arginine translocase subunit TatC [Bacillus sp. PK3_68]RJS61320.1 twin-arginine translocase subunit TatC [Bacillus sp. PK3_68]